MSAIFIINFKKHDLSFDKMNCLAKKLIEIGLREDIGVFLNSNDYATDLILNANMTDFVMLSDSFLYKNCDFLSTVEFDVSNKPKFKKDFVGKFKFIDNILDEIEKSGILQVEIFISCDGSVNKTSDFVNKEINHNEFLDELFDSIIKYSHEFAYGFPTVKFDISFSNT